LSLKKSKKQFGTGNFEEKRLLLKNLVFLMKKPVFNIPLPGIFFSFKPAKENSGLKHFPSGKMRRPKKSRASVHGKEKDKSFLNFYKKTFSGLTI